MTEHFDLNFVQNFLQMLLSLLHLVPTDLMTVLKSLHFVQS